MLLCHGIGFNAFIRASDFPFQKKQFSVSKKSEIPFRFRFTIGNVEFDEITIYISKESAVNGPSKWHN